LVKYGEPLSAYGTDAIPLKKLMDERPDWGAKLHPNHDQVKAEVIWAVRMEMAMQLEDVLARRLRILFVDAAAAMKVAPEVASLMALELGKSVEWEEEQVATFVELARGYLP